MNIPKYTWMREKQNEYRFQLTICDLGANEGGSFQPEGAEFWADNTFPKQEN